MWPTFRAPRDPSPAQTPTVDRHSCGQRAVCLGTLRTPGSYWCSGGCKGRFAVPGRQEGQPGTVCPLTSYGQGPLFSSSAEGACPKVRYSRLTGVPAVGPLRLLLNPTTAPGQQGTSFPISSGAQGQAPDFRGPSHCLPHCPPCRAPSSRLPTVGFSAGVAGGRNLPAETWLA